MTNLTATSFVVATLLSGTTLTLAEVPSPMPQAPSPAKNPSSQESSAPVAKPVPLDLPEVVDRVNGEDLKREEFERAVQDIEMQTGGAVLLSERDIVYRQVLERLISYLSRVQEPPDRSFYHRGTTTLGTNSTSVSNRRSLSASLNRKKDHLR